MFAQTFPVLVFTCQYCLRASNCTVIKYLPSFGTPGVRGERWRFPCLNPLHQELKTDLCLLHSPHLSFLIYLSSHTARCQLRWLEKEWHKSNLKPWGYLFGITASSMNFHRQRSWSNSSHNPETYDKPWSRFRIVQLPESQGGPQGVTLIL